MSLDFVKLEVMSFLRELFYNSSFKRSLYVTFLVLITKKGRVKDLKDFTPIILVKGVYKLLTKFLANRLKKVVGNVVLTYQHAFVKDKKSLNATLIANETFD